MNCPKCDFESEFIVVMFTHKRQNHPELFENESYTIPLIGTYTGMISSSHDEFEISEDPEMEIGHDFD